MGLNFKFSNFFKKQFKNYIKKDKQLISKKLKQVKINPFRFPKLAGYKFIFKINITIENNYSRLIYVVFYPDKEYITILGIFERKHSYKDFKKLYKQILR
jgi:hypothetical protein